MALVSQFGATILAMQDALRKSVEGRGGVSRAANFLIVRLDRNRFFHDWKLPVEEALEEFRRLLHEEAERFALANGWSFSGILSIHLLLQGQEVPSLVRAEHREGLYRLAIRDDGGSRTIDVPHPTALLGRAHEGSPRSFIPVRDASRSFSREHLLLTFRDLVLHIRLLGRNRT